MVHALAFKPECLSVNGKSFRKLDGRSELGARSASNFSQEDIFTFFSKFPAMQERMISLRDLDKAVYSSKSLGDPYLWRSGDYCVYKKNPEEPIKGGDIIKWVEQLDFRTSVPVYFYVPQELPPTSGMLVFPISKLVYYPGNRSVEFRRSHNGRFDPENDVKVVDIMRHGHAVMNEEGFPLRSQPFDVKALKKIHFARDNPVGLDIVAYSMILARYSESFPCAKLPIDPRVVDVRNAVTVPQGEFERLGANGWHGCAARSSGLMDSRNDLHLNLAWGTRTGVFVQTG